MVGTHTSPDYRRDFFDFSRPAAMTLVPPVQIAGPETDHDDRDIFVEIF